MFSNYLKAQTEESSQDFYRQKALKYRRKYLELIGGAKRTYNELSTDDGIYTMNDFLSKYVITIQEDTTKLSNLENNFCEILIPSTKAYEEKRGSKFILCIRRYNEINLIPKVFVRLEEFSNYQNLRDEKQLDYNIIGYNITSYNITTILNENHSNVIGCIRNVMDCYMYKKSKFQFLVIDALAKTESNIEVYTGYLKEHKKLKKELKQLQQFQAEALKEHDYNAFLLNELVVANLKEGALENLEEEFELLNNVEVIQVKLEEANVLLNEEQAGILTSLRAVKLALQKLATISTTHQDVFDRVTSSLIALEDVLVDIERVEGNLDADPSRLEIVNAQLATINNLLQKHLVKTVEELIVIREELLQKVEATENADQDILDKEEEITAIEKLLNVEARHITEKRNKAIPDFKKQLEAILVQLCKC